MAQAGDLDCRQRGLKWINPDALVTPHRDYQMKRQEQIRRGCFFHRLIHPELSCQRRNHGAMKYGQKMLFLRVSLCSHACIYPACTAQPLTDWPFSTGELVLDPTHSEPWDCVPVPSHDRGQSKWEHRPDCASESVKHPPNVT